MNNTARVKAIPFITSEELLKKESMPIEYIPLKYENVIVGQEYGPLSYIVKPHSHLKTLRLLENSQLNGHEHMHTDLLLPSEIWGWARTLSKYFGRLNAIAVTNSRWEIFGSALADQLLIASTEISNKYIRRGLPYIEAITTTKNEHGQILLKAKETVLLTSDITAPFYVEKDKPAIHLPESPIYDVTRKVYFRHQWNGNEWKNNMHVDDYAQSFGYKRGLPEFIVYMDWIFMTVFSRLGEMAFNRICIETDKILPIYEGEAIRIVSEKTAPFSYDVRFFNSTRERLQGKIFHLPK